MPDTANPPKLRAATLSLRACGKAEEAAINAAGAAIGARRTSAAGKRRRATPRKSPPSARSAANRKKLEMPIKWKILALKLPPLPGGAKRTDNRTFKT